MSYLPENAAFSLSDLPLCYENTLILVASLSEKR